MSDKKYSYSEISKMGDILRRLMTPQGVPYNAEDIRAAAEDRLRTCMEQGITLEELKQEWNDAYRKRFD